MRLNKRNLGFLGIAVLVMAVTLPLVLRGQSQRGPDTAPQNNNQVSTTLSSDQNAANLPAGTGYVAHLIGFEEAPRIDTEALGQATLYPSADGNALVCKLVLVNMRNITGANIHLAPKGQNGPVVATLYSPAPPAVNFPGRFDGVLSEKSITAADLEGSLAGQPLSKLIGAMNLGEAYINIYTEQAPTGEIRGQIYGQDANNVVSTLTSVVDGMVTDITGNNVSFQTEGRALTVIRDNNTVIDTGDVGPSAQLAVGTPVQVFFDPVTNYASIIELEKPGDIVTTLGTTKVSGIVESFSGMSVIVKNISGELKLVEVLSSTELKFEDGTLANRTDIKPGVTIEATVRVGARWATRIEVRR